MSELDSAFNLIYAKIKEQKQSLDSMINGEGDYIEFEKLGNLLDSSCELYKSVLTAFSLGICLNIGKAEGIKALNVATEMIIKEVNDNIKRMRI